jgi:hypothetical protein
VNISILRDDGASGSFVEVHAASVNANPSLNSFVVTNLPASPIGKTIKFKITSYNKAGYSTTSKPLSVVVASTPDTPITAPLADLSVTSG